MISEHNMPVDKMSRSWQLNGYDSALTEIAIAIVEHKYSTFSQLVGHLATMEEQLKEAQEDE